MVFQDLLTNKDDYLRASRALLREIIKQTKHEVNFQAFCLGLMQERREPQHLDMEFKVPSSAPVTPVTLGHVHSSVSSKGAPVLE
jgi:integrator complex subunit 1